MEGDPLDDNDSIGVLIRSDEDESYACTYGRFEANGIWVHTSTIYAVCSA